MLNRISKIEHKANTFTLYAYKESKIIVRGKFIHEIYSDLAIKAYFDSSKQETLPFSSKNLLTSSF